MKWFLRCVGTGFQAAAPRYGGSFSVTRSRSKKALRAAEQERADVARARRRWMREQGTFDPARLVFIDETSANTKMVRLYGRCARGERLVSHVPQGHWKTITFVAALRRHGMTAPQTIDGSMTGRKFLALYRTASCSDPQAQGYRHDRQPAGTQGGRCSRGHRGARRKASLSAQIFARPEPDRDAFQQAQGGSAQGRRTDNSASAPPDRPVRAHSDH